MADFTVVKELIRESIDPVLLLEYYGVDVPNRNFRYGAIRCPCPIHGGDNETGFGFDLNNKQFTCFTKGCGGSPEDWWFVPKQGGVSRDIYLFIKLMEERKAREEGRRNYVCPFPQALEIASQLAGIPIDESTSSYNKEMLDKLDNQRFIRQMNRIQQDVELDPINEDEIEIFKAHLPMCEYAETRNFSEDIVELFEWGYSHDGVDEPWASGKQDFDGRLIFPVRDDNGVLVGWSGRLATQDKVRIKKYGKWRHMLDFEKGFVLYNYDKAKEFVEEMKELILVEGPFDVQRLWSYGIYNVVAVMGASLTPEQLSIAISSAFKIHIWLDGDGAGESGSNRIGKQLLPYVNVYQIKTEKDPDDLTFDEAWDALSKAERFIPKEEKRDARSTTGNRRNGYKPR